MSMTILNSQNKIKLIQIKLNKNNKLMKSKIKK